MCSPVAYRGSTHWGGGGGHRVEKCVLSLATWRNEPKHFGRAIFGRERSDQARGSVATERGEGVGGCPPSHGRELFHFSTWKCAIWGIPKKPPPPPTSMPVTSVASFLVLGGGARPPNVPTKMYILRERTKRASASEIYFQDSKYICLLYNQCNFLYLWYMAL